MKKTISLLLAFAVCLTCLSFLTFAQEPYNKYTDAEKERIYQRYLDAEYMADELFGNSAAVRYKQTLEHIENKYIEFGGVTIIKWNWAFEAASWLIGEYPNKQDYAEILANLMTMQSGDLAEQIENQSQYDNLKNGTDYAMDIVGIASDFAGSMDLLKQISPIIDAATGGAGVIIDNVEQAKYYATSIGDYSQSKLFLEAVSNYADNEELREVASSLLTANDTLLEKRLEYLTASLETSAKYQAEFFFKNMSFGLLKETDAYKDKIVKWFVNGAEKGVEFLLSVPSAAFKATLLAGDSLVGTSDTFNRYQEMKIVSDISNALIEANHNVQTPLRYDSPDALNIIRTKCDYYKMLIVTHARGEYLIYQLLVNDAKLWSDIKQSGITREETENWYNGQAEVLTRYYNTFKNIFIIEDESMATDLEHVPQNAPELNGHYYYVYDLDAITTWEEAQEYCESQGGYLATITSQEENEFVYSYLRSNFDYESAYFGFTDRNEEGTWIWANGEKSSYTNWHPGEPNSENPNEDYAMYYFKYSDGTWNDGDFGNRTVNSGRVFICEWGEYNDQHSTTSPEDENTALGKYLAAVSKTTESGSWTEQLSLEADLLVTNGSSKTKTKMTLNSTSDVSNYIEGNLSNIQVSSISDMTIMGQTYAWSTEYQDGVAHYQYTEPVQTSQDLEIDPNFFDFDVITQEAIIDEETSGNQIRFTISGDSMAAAGIAAVEQINGVDNLKYGDVEVTVTLSNLDTVETIVMVFDASMEYQGFNSDVSYHIQYRFV